MEAPNKTIIKLTNVDNTIRVIKPSGNYTYESALLLCRALEGDNFKTFTILK